MSQQPKPIRILHVVTNMSFGGLENLLMNYYRNIDRSKIQFDFLTHVDIHQDFEEEIRELGGRLYRLPRMNPFSPDYLRRLNSFFCEHPEYQIVHSHLDCMAGLPLKYAQCNNVPVRIAHAHSSNQVRNLKYVIKMMYKPWILRYATDLFACGKKAGEWMFNGKPFAVVNNAIDTEPFAFQQEISERVRESLNINGKFVLGHVGQFRQEKNHLFLIDIFGEVVRKNPDSVLLLVGKGAQMEPVMAKVKELGLEDSVKFLGARPDIARLMQAMDVFVLPSLYEGLPVTMIEAQAAGLPCVISDGVPLECKITENVAQIPLAASPELWAEEILKYKNVLRTHNHTAIAAAGFDIKSNAKKLEEFYYNAINRR